MARLLYTYVNKQTSWEETFADSCIQKWILSHLIPKMHSTENTFSWREFLERLIGICVLLLFTSSYLLIQVAYSKLSFFSCHYQICGKAKEKNIFKKETFGLLNQCWIWITVGDETIKPPKKGKHRKEICNIPGLKPIILSSGKES